MPGMGQPGIGDLHLNNRTAQLKGPCNANNKLSSFFVALLSLLWRLTNSVAEWSSLVVAEAFKDFRRVDSFKVHSASYS